MIPLTSLASPCAPSATSTDSRLAYRCALNTTVADSGRAQGPPRAHPLWCRQNATPAVTWSTDTGSGRSQGPR
eukprot:6968937-Pyramimonas_sp.AAC.1